MTCAHIFLHATTICSCDDINKQQNVIIASLPVITIQMVFVNENLAIKSLEMNSYISA